MKCPQCISRRRFLELGSKSLSALVIAGPLLSACNQQPLASGAGDGGGATIPNSPSGVYTLGFTDYPQLQSAGGTLFAKVQASSGEKDVFITRVSASSVVTVSNVCTHAGCTVNPYDPSTQQYLCPCHNSIFSATGAVVSGPANAPLPTYESVISATGIQVTIS